MSDLTDTAAEAAIGPTARARLASFVQASLLPGVLQPGAVALWAGFLNAALHDPALRAIHEQTYLAFRDRLESLIAAALDEAGRPASPAALRAHAIAANAVIDGLWLEGGALPERFATGELAAIAVDTVASIVGIPLLKKEQ